MISQPENLFFEELCRALYGSAGGTGSSWLGSLSPSHTTSGSLSLLL